MNPESGSRKGCVHKGESTQRQETYSGTRTGPAISLPLHPPPRSADLDMAETKRTPRENTGTLELVFHAITPSLLPFAMHTIGAVILKHQQFFFKPLKRIQINGARVKEFTLANALQFIFIICLLVLASCKLEVTV